jgi:hypothetical protein
MFTYTVLCDAACALFFLILPISTFMCSSPPFLLDYSPPPHTCRYSNNDGAVNLSAPEASAPPSTPPPSAKSKMEEAVVRKAVDVAVANPEATKKLAVAAVTASSDI